MDLIDAVKSIDRTHEEDTLARLTTIWGERVQEGEGNVRLEHPTPQCRRRLND